MLLSATHSYEKAKKDLAKALTTLEEHLKDKKYLANDQHVTFADIVVISTLLYPFKLVCEEKTYLRPFPNVVRWFKSCVAQPEFRNVVGTVTLCQRELLAEGQIMDAPSGK